MALHGPMQISAETLSGAAAVENLGDVHFTMAAEPKWRDEEATREHAQHTMNNLGRLGLADRRGLDPDFRDVVLTLARPAQEFSAIFVQDDEVVYALAACTGNEAVIAVRRGDVVDLRPARRDLLAEALVHVLPHVPAARGRAVNVPAADVQPEAQQPSRHRRADEGWGGLQNRNPAQQNPDVAHLHRILAQEKVGGGQLFAGVRDRGGRPHTSPFPLSFMDTPDGRWMNQTTTTRTGEKWIIAAPANNDLLITRLHEMQQALMS